MKILITGGCGFVGSNIAIFLKKKLWMYTLIHFQISSNGLKNFKLAGCELPKKKDDRYFKLLTIEKKAKIDVYTFLHLHVQK